MTRTYLKAFSGGMSSVLRKNCGKGARRLGGLGGWVILLLRGSLSQRKFRRKGKRREKRKERRMLPRKND